MKRFLRLLVVPCAMATASVAVNAAAEGTASAASCAAVHLITTTPQGAWYGECTGYASNARFRVMAHCENLSTGQFSDVYGPWVPGGQDPSTGVWYRSYAYCPAGKPIQWAVGYITYV